MWEPVDQDLTVYIGGDFDETLTLYQDTAKTLPLPLAGYHALLTTDDGLVALSDSLGLSLGATDGTIRITMPSSQTSNFTAGVSHYRLKLTDPAAKVAFPINGTLRYVHA